MPSSVECITVNPSSTDPAVQSFFVCIKLYTSLMCFESVPARPCRYRSTRNASRAHCWIGSISRLRCRDSPKRSCFNRGPQRLHAIFEHALNEHGPRKRNGLRSRFLSPLGRGQVTGKLRWVRQESPTSTRRPKSCNNLHDLGAALLREQCRRCCRRNDTAP